MNNFSRGQKVTLVDSGTGQQTYPGFRRMGFAVPVLGVIYTIRDIRSDHSDKSIIGLHFWEIRNGVGDFDEGMLEPSFWAGEFRPVVQRPTDISALTKLLKTRTYSELVL